MNGQKVIYFEREIHQKIYIRTRFVPRANCTQGPLYDASATLETLSESQWLACHAVGEGSRPTPLHRRCGLRIFCGTWNVAEREGGFPDVHLVRRWLPPNQDVYAVTLQECLDPMGALHMLRRALGPKYHYADHSIGNATTALGYHGFVYLAVFVRARVADEGVATLAGLTRAGVALGRKLLVARAENKGAVAISVPLRIPSSGGHSVASSLIFVGCHLASDSKGRSKLEARLDDARELIASLGIATAVRNAPPGVASMDDAISPKLDPMRVRAMSDDYRRRTAAESESPSTTSMHDSMSSSSYSSPLSRLGRRKGGGPSVSGRIKSSRTERTLRAAREAEAEANRNRSLSVSKLAPLTPAAIWLGPSLPTLARLGIASSSAYNAAANANSIAASLRPEASPQLRRAHSVGSSSSTPTPQPSTETTSTSNTQPVSEDTSSTSSRARITQSFAPGAPSSKRLHSKQSPLRPPAFLTSTVPSGRLYAPHRASYTYVSDADPLAKGTPSDDLALTQQPPPSHAYVFIAGDVNFRLRMPPPQALREIAHAETASAQGTKGGERPWHRLLALDELRGTMASGDAFPGFREARINFPPTYRRVLAPGGALRRSRGDYSSMEMLSRGFTTYVVKGRKKKLRRREGSKGSEGGQTSSKSGTGPFRRARAGTGAGGGAAGGMGKTKKGGEAEEEDGEEKEEDGEEDGEGRRESGGGSSRTPSWTDRVLVRPPTCVRPQMPPVYWTSYAACDVLDGSDHLAVGATLELDLRPASVRAIAPTGPPSGRASLPSGEYGVKLLSSTRPVRKPVAPNGVRAVPILESFSDSEDSEGDLSDEEDEDEDAVTSLTKIQDLSLPRATDQSAEAKALAAGIQMALADLVKDQNAHQNIESKEDEEEENLWGWKPQTITLPNNSSNPPPIPLDAFLDPQVQFAVAIDPSIPPSEYPQPPTHLFPHEKSPKLSSTKLDEAIDPDDEEDYDDKISHLQKPISNQHQKQPLGKVRPPSERPPSPPRPLLPRQVKPPPVSLLPPSPPNPPSQPNPASQNLPPRPRAVPPPLPARPTDRSLRRLGAMDGPLPTPDSDTELNRERENSTILRLLGDTPRADLLLASSRGRDPTDNFTFHEKDDSFDEEKTSSSSAAPPQQLPRDIHGEEEWPKAFQERRRRFEP